MWLEERRGAGLLGGGFSKDRVSVLAVSRKQAGWFQERLWCFMKDWVLVSGVVSGGDVFTARLFGFKKMCAPYDVGSQIVKG